MVLKDIPQGAGCLVVLSAAFDADVFGHRDLHVVDVAPVPDGLEDPIGKAEHEDVLYGLFAQVVVDAIDLLFGEDAVDCLVERLRALQVVPERLLDHDAFPALAGFGNARRAEPVDDHGKELRRGRQVEDAVAVGSPLPIHPLQLRGQPAVARLVVERHPDVGDPVGQALPDGAIDWLAPGELLHRLLHVGAELVFRQRRIGDADHAEAGRQIAIERQVVERWHQLACGQVPGRAEDHHRRRVRGARQDEPVAKHVLRQRGRGCLRHALFRPDGMSPEFVAQRRQHLGAERIILP